MQESSKNDLSKTQQSQGSQNPDSKISSFRLNRGPDLGQLKFGEFKARPVPKSQYERPSKKKEVKAMQDPLWLQNQQAKPLERACEKRTDPIKNPFTQRLQTKTIKTPTIFQNTQIQETRKTLVPQVQDKYKKDFQQTYQGSFQNRSHALLE